MFDDLAVFPFEKKRNGKYLNYPSKPDFLLAFRLFLLIITASKQEIIKAIPAKRQITLTAVAPGKSKPVNPKRADTIVIIKK